MSHFQALVLNKDPEIKELSVDELPEGEVLVKVHYSNLNYKDGLAVTGKGKIVREFPFVPGIDFAGVVEESSSPDYKPGDEVILTGWGVGERYWGGYAQYARVKADWLVPLPDGLTLKEAMIIGTAGFTAALSVVALEEQGVKTGEEVLVTGATGGVGSFAVYLLAKQGYHVTASTGKESSHDYLRKLGASNMIDRALLSEKGKPLDAQKWAGAIDTVGSQTLANVLSQMKYDGTVTACGLAGGNDLPSTVFPFILRGVKLVGIDSVMVSYEKRVKAWKQLAETVDATVLESVVTEITLKDVPEYAERITNGEIQGRTIVNVQA
ncbi:MDR family oxidoreductase [Metabacillus iocasae]|uniref:Acrylyl-CoA reductase (NADPH) n=1 Tax=Priestia iocasae TaxID=2291674 RepID=A0ABS2QTW0_9BACI|nr:MDR family oxidoreductase [Metabacillus iocasae]MBM7702845.1 acrylyl-CoA reductase (NADPH) [Metabacillus iocasae]